MGEYASSQRGSQNEIELNPRFSLGLAQSAYFLTAPLGRKSRRWLGRRQVLLRMPRVRFYPLNRDPLDLIECNLLPRPVIELCGARAFMRGHSLGVF